MIPLWVVGIVGVVLVVLVIYLFASDRWGGHGDKDKNKEKDN